ATFTGTAGFGGATFTGTAGFGGATFTGTAQFGKATFAGAAWFGEATFTGAARFGGASGLAEALLDGVRVAPAAEGVRRVWPPCWRAEAAADGWQTLRLEAAGGEDGAAAEPRPEPGGLT
ncbi:pentapeptide repeat-containing protein, partial [Nonomuraea wenchangensis]|uniref:pentapeptide repeat-containing protein n=1 Tax=Nonomuraea wenchangensis TaxID=568860 RepID=UPI00343360E3